MPQTHLFSSVRVHCAGIRAGSHQADKVLAGTAVGLLLLPHQRQPPGAAHTALMLFSSSFTHKASPPGVWVNTVMNGAVLNLGRWEYPCYTSGWYSITLQKEWNDLETLHWSEAETSAENKTIWFTEQSKVSRRRELQSGTHPRKRLSLVMQRREICYWSKSRLAEGFLLRAWTPLSSVNRERNVQRGDLWAAPLPVPILRPHREMNPCYLIILACYLVYFALRRLLTLM